MAERPLNRLGMWGDEPVPGAAPMRGLGPPPTVASTGGSTPVLMPLGSGMPQRPGAAGEAATWGRPSTPKSAGYSDAEAPAELMAEAVRAYLADPNYMKIVAPKSAAAIRAAVNGNPRLNQIVQFNSGGDGGKPIALGLLGSRPRARGAAFGGTATGAWVDEDPSRRM